MGRWIGLWAIVGILANAWVASRVDGGLIAMTGGDGTESVLYELNPANGQVIRTIGSTGLFNAGGMAFHPGTGDLYVHVNNLPFDDGQLYRINPQTMVAQLIGPTHIGVDDLAFGSDGTLYGWMGFHDGTFFSNSTIYQLVKFDLNTGLPQIIGNSTTLMFDIGLAFAPNGRMYFKGIDGVDVGGGVFEYHSHLLEIDPLTATLNHVVQLSDANGGGDIYPDDVLTFDGAGQAFTVTRIYDNSNPFQSVFQASYLQRIDLATGQVTTVSPQLPLEITGLVFSNQFASVPEPSTFCFVAAVGCLSVWRHRRRRACLARHRVTCREGISLAQRRKDAKEVCRSVFGGGGQ